jgi:hypothetical protein
MPAGERVSVDKMVSPIQGLNAYHAKVHVLDHARWPSNGDRIRPYASKHGISVKAHHADNRIFKANKWVDICKKAGQGLTFASVNSHHENGIAEWRIKEILDVARTMLIHANRRWKHSRIVAVVEVWPYAVRMASDQINNLPWMQSADKRTPLQAFANSDVHTC